MFRRNCIGDKYYEQLSLMSDKREMILLRGYTYQSSNV